MFYGTFPVAIYLDHAGGKHANRVHAAITVSSHAINSLQNEMSKETLTVFLFITCISSAIDKDQNYVAE